MPASAPTPRSDAARAALIAAGLDLFGRLGFDGVSTRAIASAAKVNIAAIAYHFGGKEGLRLAVAEHVAGLMGATLARAIAGEPPVAVEELTVAAAEERLTVFLATFARFLIARPEAATIARFMVREHLDPSPAFDVVYKGVIAPMHARACALLACACGGDAADPTLRIAALALTGQALYFRLGRPVVMRRLGWDTLGEAEAEAIVATLRLHTLAIIAAHRRPSP